MMRKIALRGVRAHWVQFVLSVLAVTLGVAFVSGTFSLRTMLAGTFDSIMESSMRADVYLRGGTVTDNPAADPTEVGGVRTTIPMALAEQIEARDDVAVALPDISGPVVLVGADGTAVLSTQAPSFASAYDPKEPGPVVVQGRHPQAAGEIALESYTMASSGLAVGDDTSLVIGGQVQQVRVVGEISMAVPLAGATMVFVDTATAQAQFAADGEVPTVAVFAADGVDAEDLRAALAAEVTGDVEAITGADRRAETSAAISEMLGFMSTFLLAFAGIALFVGGFIIANTFTMSVRQRIREFALLRAVGAAPRQVFASILGQAVVVGLLGSALGIVAGFGLVEAIRAVMSGMGTDLVGDLPITATGVAVSVAVGVVVSVASAALPARRAALIRPVEAMREEVSAADRPLTVRGWAGLALFAAGVGLVLGSLGGSASAGTLLGLGAVGVVVGALLLAPVIAGGVLRVLAAPFVALLRPLGALARGNVTRNPRRTANTAGALMVGMALVSATSVLALSAKVSVDEIVRSEATADFMIRSATGTLPEGVVEAVPALDGVAEADLVAFGPVVLDGETVYVATVPAEAFGRSLQIEVVEGDLGSLADGEIAVMADAVDAHDWRLGGTVQLADAAVPGATPVDFTIGAVIDSKAFSTDVLLPADRGAEVGATTPEMYFVQAADGVAPDDLRAELAEAVSPYVVISVLDTEEYAGEIAGQVESMLAILYALLALSVIIAVLGIVNTLALSVIERTREIGLLRAVGLGRGQLSGTIVIESVLIAVFGTAVGLVIGTGLAGGFPAVFEGQGLTTLAVPWDQLGGMLGLAVVVGVLAALWPAVRAARLPVLDAVSYE